MFNSVIGSLASLLPKYFIFGSYVPTLIFLFINGTLVYGNVAAVRTALAGLPPAGWSLAVSAAFVFSIVFAYVFSSMSSLLRDVLEGKHLLSAVANPMRDREAAILKNHDNALKRAHDDAAGVREATAGWTDAMRAAGKHGRQHHRDHTGYDPLNHSAGIALRLLQRTMSSVTYDALNHLVHEFCGALRTFDSSKDTGIQADFQEVRTAFKDATNVLDAKEADAYTRRNQRFGVTTPAPTRMGNVAAALQGYTLTRYGFDLDTMWSRLLVVLQRTDEKAYGSLLDAKTQLDFLVACYWLSAATTLVWSLLLVTLSSSPLTFLVVAAGGAAAVVGFYALCVTYYVAYGSVVRATVDLSRFALLRQLHIPLPGGKRDEMVLWSTLAGVSSFANPAELSYDHGP